MSGNADIEQTEHVRRTDVGVSIEYVSTRGTDTRDKDQVKTKVKAETLAKALEMSDGALRNHAKELKRLRKIQPDEEDGR